MNDVWQVTQKETIEHFDLVQRLGCPEGHLLSWCVSQQPERLHKYPLVESICFLSGQTEVLCDENGTTISTPAYHAGPDVFQLVAMIHGSASSKKLENLQVSLEVLTPFARTVMIALRRDIDRVRLSSAPRTHQKA